MGAMSSSTFRNERQAGDLRSQEAPPGPPSGAAHAGGPRAGKRGKDARIETLRALALLFMVAGHVIGGTKGNGMHVADDSFARYFYNTFVYLRLPLFTVISGYVYALRPVVRGHGLTFIKGKARRILLPLIFVSTLEYLMRCTVPGLNTPAKLVDIWRIYCFGFDHFWFLQALFLCFLVILVLELLACMERPANWLLCLIGAVLVYLLLPWRVTFFSFNSAMYLLPFFLLGCGIHRFETVLSRKAMIIPVAAVFVAGMTLHQLLLLGGTNLSLERHAPLGMLMGMLIGLSGNLLLFHFRFQVRGLARLGVYAYSIYLFHIFGTAPGRIMAVKCGIENRAIVFAISLLLGIAVPIVMETLLCKNRLLRRLFLGLS